LCNRAAKRIRLDVIRKTPPAVDLDDRQPFAVRLLQLGYAGDVDLAQLEAELVPELSNLLERAFAEVAAPCVIDGDLDRSTGRCHV
jgi:hypothetical protein